MKVLVVDDSPVMRKIIIRGLKGIGVTNISEATNGAEGWQLFESDTFDVVVTDWNMPTMNGLELLKSIRGSGSDVPVIMVTTEAENPKIVLAVQAGVTDYLCKPFEQDELRAKIDKFVPA